MGEYLVQLVDRQFRGSNIHRVLPGWIIGVSIRLLSEFPDILGDLVIGHKVKLLKDKSFFLIVLQLPPRVE